MTETMRRAATLPDGRVIPYMQVNPNDPEGRIATLSYFDDDKGRVIVGQEVSGDFAPFLAAASTLYEGLEEAGKMLHAATQHSGEDFRTCPFIICQRVSRRLALAEQTRPY